MQDNEIDELIENMEACPLHSAWHDEAIEALRTMQARIRELDTEAHLAKNELVDAARTVNDQAAEIHRLRSQQARIRELESQCAWIPADQEKPSQSERVLLAIRHEDCPVVGYWGAGTWDVCTVNMEVSCGMYCNGGIVVEGFKSDDVIAWLRIPGWDAALEQEDET